MALDGRTLDTLAAHRRHQLEDRLKLGGWPEHDLVFAQADGTPIHPDRVSAALGRLVESAGLSELSLHGLRHTAATLLMASGENPELVRQRLGHENVKTTLSLYTHAQPAAMRASAERPAGLVDA